MLKPVEDSTQVTRRRRHLQRLWSDVAANTPSLGCGRCPERSLCGGLHVRAAAFDCLSQACCNSPDACDRVCRRKATNFAERFREVSGFAFDDVPRARRLQADHLPLAVPVLYNASRREQPFSASAVCLPLYKVIGRRGPTVAYPDRRALEAGFLFAEGVPVILTGTDTDPPLERWWSLGSDGRRAAIRSLRDLGVSMVTSPNFSLFSDQPRWDDLHSMKRIALAHNEFLAEGMPAALHVNARTDRDYERWSEFLAGRPEITHLAFEFGTGAGAAGRIHWHASKLTLLAANVNRPLHLVVRGGIGVLPLLASRFARLTILDTSTVMKTAKRQRATMKTDGTLVWNAWPTLPGAPLDDLLAENWCVVSDSYSFLASQRTPRMAATG